jgi:hypothetical protein
VQQLFLHSKNVEKEYCTPSGLRHFPYKIT